jgi:uncharacterized membrane protein
MTTNPDERAVPTTTPYRAPDLPKVSGMAVASLVCGIVWGYWITSILAVIFAAVALRQIRESNGWRTGRGMAIAGLVLGLIGCATLVLFIVALLIDGNS